MIGPTKHPPTMPLHGPLCVVGPFEPNEFGDYPGTIMDDEENVVFFGQDGEPYVLGDLLDPVLYACAYTRSFRDADVEHCPETGGVCVNTGTGVRIRIVQGPMPKGWMF